MSKPVVHASNMRPNRYGGFNNGTLCGRISNATDEPINAAGDGGTVTCKLCLKKMKQNSGKWGNYTRGADYVG